MKRYPLHRLLLLLTLPLLMSGCVPPQGPPAGLPATDRARTFTAAFAALPMSLAPYGPHSWHKTQVLPLIYDGLTALDANLHPMPALASSWTVSADGLVYTIRLRQQVKFHHGKELDAADVRYTFQRAAPRPTLSQESRALVTAITAIETPDSHTVRFVLQEPYAPFLTKLTAADYPIVPHDSPPPWESVPPGTGPFQLVGFQPGQSISLKKFAAYWDSDLPRLEAVVLRAVTHASTRWSMLHNGDIDYALLAPLYQSAPSAADQDVVVVTSAPTGTFSVVFNTRRQPCADAEVRRAVARAVDKVALAHQVLGSYGVAMNQPFNPNASPWYVDVADHTPDLYEARELLIRAGYPAGLRINLPVIASATLFTKTAWALREQLQSVGIDLQVELSAAHSVRHRMQQNDWDVLLRGEEPYTDADDVYFEAFHSSRVGISNISGYHTPTLDALLSAGRRTLSLLERQQLYRQVVRQLQRDVPELYLFMARWPVAWRQRVQGYDGRLLQCCLLQTLTSIAHQGFKTIWLAD